MKYTSQMAQQEITPLLEFPLLTSPKKWTPSKLVLGGYSPIGISLIDLFPRNGPREIALQDVCPIIKLPHLACPEKP